MTLKQVHEIVIEPKTEYIIMKGNRKNPKFVETFTIDYLANEGEKACPTSELLEKVYKTYKSAKVAFIDYNSTIKAMSITAYIKDTQE